MKQVVIENPILNSAFAEPSRYWKFTDEGITDEIVESRRISSYFVPIAQPRFHIKKKRYERICREAETAGLKKICEPKVGASFATLFQNDK